MAWASPVLPARGLERSGAPAAMHVSRRSIERRQKPRTQLTGASPQDWGHSATGPSGAAVAAGQPAPGEPPWGGGGGRERQRRRPGTPEERTATTREKGLARRAGGI